MVRELSTKLRQYKDLSLDPDSTLSIPDLIYMCELADKLADRLESRK